MIRIFGAALIALSVLSAGPRALGADDWPQFRGPTGQGISTVIGVPVSWSASKNIAWKTPVPGRGWSSPVLANGKVFLTAATGTDSGPVSLYAVCFDAGTGKPVWDTELFKPDHGSARTMHKKNTLASATPIITGDRLYVHFGHMGTAALDLSGKVIWKQTGIKYSPVHGNGGSPALVGGKLIFSCDGSADPFVVALDAATGDVKWKTPRNTHARRKFSFSTPLVIEAGGMTQAVLPGSGMVASYDPASGKEIWRVRYGEGYSVVPRPVFANGVLAVSSGFDNAVLYGIDPANAKGDATNSSILWTKRKGAPCTPSPLAVGDEIYFISDLGVATCADLKTGTTHWTNRIGAAGYSASPVCADGHIYFQNEEGVGYVIKAGKTFTPVSENDLGERSLSSYAVAEGALFIRTEKHLWKIAADR
jgi:outer membrane protein assembly factor BamB